MPDSWLLGHIKKIRTGYALNETVRRNGASGGVTTAVLCYLLESKYIDAAIVVQQGTPSPEKASVVIAHSRDEVLASAQSVYIPVSTLDILTKFKPGMRYAITCLPEQAASLRVLQCLGYGKANNIGLKEAKTKYALILNPDTKLFPKTLENFLTVAQQKPDFAIIGPNIIDDESLKEFAVSVKKNEEKGNNLLQIFVGTQILPVH